MQTMSLLYVYLYFLNHFSVLDARADSKGKAKGDFWNADETRVWKYSTEVAIRVK